jgi:hypothetical protein
MPINIDSVSTTSPRAQVIFDLPGLLPVPDGDYQVSLNSKAALITLSTVQGVRRFEGTTAVAEMATELPFHFTRVNVRMLGLFDPDAMVDDSKLLHLPPLRELKQVAIAYVNRLIEVVRSVTKQLQLQRIRNYGVAFYDAAYWDGKGDPPFMRQIRGEALLKMPKHDSKSFPPEQVQSIKDILATELPVDASEVFMPNAKDEVFTEDYRRAIVDAVTSLDVRLSGFIRQRCKNLGVGEDTVNGFITAEGLARNLEVVLPMLAPSSNPPDKKLLSKCKGAITIRNKVLHEGRLVVTLAEADEHIEAIEKMIAYLDGISRAKALS